MSNQANHETGTEPRIPNQGPSSQDVGGSITSPHGWSEEEGGTGGDTDPKGIVQAARAVMHPERHDTEWRYYHSALRR